MQRTLTESEIIQAKLLTAVKNGDLGLIERYVRFHDDCNDGSKFIEVMTLANQETESKKPALKGKSAITVAAKNRHLPVLEFIIARAMRDEIAKMKLAELLVEKNPEGKNVLHEATHTQDNGRVIQLLCATARQLHEQGVTTSQDLAEYVNVRDSEYGSTALHFAVRQAQFANYAALRSANASVEIKAKNGMLPIDLIQYGDPRVTFPFMKQWISQTEEGKRYFLHRYGCQFSALTDARLDDIIRIDLDIRLKDNAAAQFNAYIETMRLIPTCSNHDLSACISNFGYINFAVITGRIPDLSANNHNGAVELLEKGQAKASYINTPETRNLFIRAEILRQLKGIPAANTEAFECYGCGALMNQYPQIALDGIKQLDTRLLSQPVLAKRLVVAHTNIFLHNLRRNPQQKSGFPLFGRRQSADEVIEKFLTDLRNAVTVNDIVAFIQKLPQRQDIIPLHETLMSELEAEKLIAARLQRKP